LTMATLADEDRFSPRSRRAFIAPHPLAFGMANMFIKLRRPVGNVENREVYGIRIPGVACKEKGPNRPPEVGRNRRGLTMHSRSDVSRRRAHASETRTW
jgi:hypothetical protein